MMKISIHKFWGWPLPLLLLLFGPTLQAAGLNVVATTPDLGSVAQAIGGDQITLSVLAGPNEDPHFVDPKPSFVRILNKADLLIEGGADLETGWLPPLLQTARNSRILGKNPGHLMAADFVKLMDLPSGNIDRSQGDVHPAGNPHFMLSPANAASVAVEISQRLQLLDPTHSPVYQENLKKFLDQLGEKTREWSAKALKIKGRKVISYHSSFNYLLQFLELELAQTIESKPGIEPSPTHIKNLITELQGVSVLCIISEPNRPKKTVEKVARSLSIPVVWVSPMPGATEKTKGYLEWIGQLMTQVEGASQLGK